MMIRDLWSTSFNRKLILLVTATAMVALLLSLAAIIGFETVTYRKLLVRELETLADILGLNSRAALVFRAPEDARQILSSLRAKPHVSSACLYTPEGEELAAYLRDVGPTDETVAGDCPRPLLEGTTFARGHVALLRHVYFDDEQIGTIYLVSELDGFYRQLQGSAATAAIIFIASSLLALLLSRKALDVVSRPIFALVEIASRVSRSRDYSLRAAVRSEDELGRLTHAFNRMLEQIQAGDAELQLAHDELRQRLEELQQEKEELNKAQERQRELQQRLSRLERMESLGVLAGGVAHDLNNLLGPLVGYPSLILNRISEEDEDGVRPMIGRIADSANKASAVIQDFLTLGQRGIHETEVLALNPLIISYLDSPGFLELQGRRPEVTVRQDLDPELWPVRGSAPHLTQVVMNLTINAFEAMPDGGELRIETRRRALPETLDGFELIEPGRYVTLSVADTGSGIDPEDLSHIFEPFFTRKKLGRSGSGLGLAVVYGVIKDLGGRIDLSSTPGTGTQLTLYLPQAATLSAQTESGPERLDGHERILVVDDVEEQRQLAIDILTGFGYEPLVAENGPQALRLLEREDVDLVVLDMILEDGFDGLETYQRIVANKPYQRCIIVSGFSESERVKEAQALGAGQYLSKPYSPDELGRAVREELDRPQGTQA